MVLAFTSIRMVLALKACSKMISSTALEELKILRAIRARDISKTTASLLLLTTRLKHWMSHLDLAEVNLY
jgi:hypothetical protein